jgi:hypothetical protein
MHADPPFDSGRSTPDTTPDPADSFRFFAAIRGAGPAGAVPVLIEAPA